MGIKELAAGIVGVTTLSETPGDDAPSGDYSANVTPPPRSGIVGRDPFALPAFFRAVAYIVNAVARMGLESWRGSVLVDSPLIDQPDPWMTRRRFLSRTVIGLLLYGNAYWRILRNANGTVIGLRVADRGRAYRTTGGAIRYQLVFGHETFDLPANEVEHLRFLELPGLLDGLGPVQAARAQLEGIAAVREYASNWFDSADATSGVLSTDQPLLDGEADQYKKQWYTRGEYDPATGPSLRVLGRGLTYTPYFLSPKDAQWLEAQAWGVLDVARLFGLPGDFLLAAVEGSSLTYSTLEMIDTSVIKRTILPDYLSPIEEAFSNVIPRGQSARFNLADYLRPDTKTRADIDLIYIGAGVYDAKYVRERDGINTTAPLPAVEAGTPSGDPA